MDDITILENDRYQRPVTLRTDSGRDIYSIENGHIVLTVPAGTPLTKVYETLNAMAPEGWVEPEPEDP